MGKIRAEGSGGTPHLPFVGQQRGSRLPPIRADQSRELAPHEGLVLTLLPRTSFTFDGRVGSVQTLPRTPVLPAHRFRDGVLSVLVHERAGFGATTSVRVDLQDVVSVDDDPSVVFVGSSSSITVTGTSASLATVNIAPLGLAVRLAITWLQPGLALSAPASAAISVLLTLRPG